MVCRRLAQFRSLRSGPLCHLGPTLQKPIQTVFGLGPSSYGPICLLTEYMPRDPTFRQKLFFWRQGYSLRSELRPHLTVTGRRLNASAPPLAADETNAGWQDDKEHPFMVTGVNFPTLGCWEITADYHGDKLKFVVWVAH